MLRARASLNYQQATADLAVSTAEIQCAENYLGYAAERGKTEQLLAETFATEVIHNIRARLARAPADYGLEEADIATLSTAAGGDRLSSGALAALGRNYGTRHFGFG